MTTTKAILRKKSFARPFNYYTNDVINEKSKHNVHKKQLINSKINYICKYSKTFIATQGILDIC